MVLFALIYITRGLFLHTLATWNEIAIRFRTQCSPIWGWNSGRVFDIDCL